MIPEMKGLYSTHFSVDGKHFGLDGKEKVNNKCLPVGCQLLLGLEIFRTSAINREKKKSIQHNYGNYRLLRHIFCHFYNQYVLTIVRFQVSEILGEKNA